MYLGFACTGATVYGPEYSSRNFHRFCHLVSLSYLAGGIYTVNQNERAVKTNFGRAERIGVATTSIARYPRRSMPKRSNVTTTRRCA